MREPEKGVYNVVVLITGAGGGMGRPLALLFARKGYRLALADIDREGLESTAEQVRGLGCECSAYTVDLTDPGQIEDLSRKVSAEVGEVDVLVNCIGMAVNGDLLDTPVDECRRMMEVNYWSAFRMCQTFLPGMVERGSGHVVNMSSVAGLTALPTGAAYSGTKFAVAGLTEALAGEMAAKGVKVTLLCPAFVRTPIYDSMRLYGYDRQYAVAQQQSGIEPEKAAEAIMKGIEKGKFLVIVGPLGHLTYTIKRLSIRLDLLVARILHRVYQKYRLAR